LKQPAHPLCCINHRNCVWHAAYGGKPSRRGCRGTGRNRLFVGLSGLAQVHMQINEPGANDQATSVELFVSAALDRVRTRYFRYSTISKQDIHRRVHARRRVDDVATLDQQAGCVLWAHFRLSLKSVHHRAHEEDAIHRIFPIARARIAMRVGTPLCTSSTILDCGPSAMSSVNSMPRIIGPGCITMASRLASVRRAAVIW
jgi:hypothetical protein